MSNRQLIAGIFTVITIGTAALIGVGLIVGYLLNYFIPNFDFAMATLCATAATGFVVMCLLQVMIAASAHIQLIDKSDRDENGEFETETFSEDQVSEIADQLTEAVLVRLRMPGARASQSSRRHR